MMTSNVKACWRAAHKDKEFHKEAHEVDKTFTTPHLFMDEHTKILIACYYFGWLIGKGYKEKAILLDNS